MLRRITKFFESWKMALEEPSTSRKPKKKKFAMLLSYVGTNYYGMQINKGFKTIEEEIFRALAKKDLIGEDDIFSPKNFWFQRAARTDKSVSATRQMTSIQLPIDESDILQTASGLNEILPTEIRVMGIKRATRSFDSKNHCSSRSYSYTMPSFAFAPVETVITSDFRLSSEALDRAKSVLEIYKGSHNFFNYTSRREHKDDSCVRFIMDVKCEELSLRQGMEFLTIQLRGQSFMLHQIRKMIAFCIAVTRGYASKCDIQRSWESKRMDIPMAPGLGLVLEKVHYDWYDRKNGKDHALLDEWPEQEPLIEKFRNENILEHIYATEFSEKSMLQWLATLGKHTYQPRDRDNEPASKRARSSSPAPSPKNLKEEQSNPDEAEDNNSCGSNSISVPDETSA